MLQFARRSPLLCTTSAFTLSSQPSLRLSVSVKALPANSHFSGSSQFSKVTYQQLLSVYQFLKIIFLHDCTYLEGTPFYFILIGNTSRPVLPFEMWNANFPLPTGRIWCTCWALAGNASKHSPWRYSYLPSYRLHEYCLHAGTSFWGTGSALLMWTRSMISIFMYFVSEQNWTHMYIWYAEVSCFHFTKIWRGFCMWILKWTNSEAEPAQKPAAYRQCCLLASCTARIKDTQPFQSPVIPCPKHNLIYWSKLQ